MKPFLSQTYSRVSLSGLEFHRVASPSLHQQYHQKQCFRVPRGRASHAATAKPFRRSVGGFNFPVSSSATTSHLGNESAWLQRDTETGPDEPHISEPDTEWASLIQDSIGKDGSVDFESLAMSSTLATTTVRTSATGFTWVDISANVTDFSHTIQQERRHTALTATEKQKRSRTKEIRARYNQQLQTNEDVEWETLVSEIMALRNEIAKAEEEATDLAKKHKKCNESPVDDGDEGGAPSLEPKTFTNGGATTSAATTTSSEEGSPPPNKKHASGDDDITGTEDDALLEKKVKIKQEKQLLGVKRAVFRERLYERYQRLVERQKQTMTDAEFVIVIRERLEFYGIPRQLLSDVSKMILLPQTVVELKDASFSGFKTPTASNSSSSLLTATASKGTNDEASSSEKPVAAPAAGVCFVCRFAKQHPKAYYRLMSAATATSDSMLLTRIEMLAADVSVSTVPTTSMGKQTSDNQPSIAIKIPLWARLWKGLQKRLQGTQVQSTNDTLLSPARRRVIAKRSLLQTFQTARDKAVKDSNDLLGQKRKGFSRTLTTPPSIRMRKSDRTFETIQQLSHRLTMFLIPETNTAVTVHKFSIAGIDAMHGSWGEHLNKLTMDGFLRKVTVECAQSFLDLERERTIDVDMLELSLFEDVERLGASVPVGPDGERPLPSQYNSRATLDRGGEFHVSTSLKHVLNALNPFTLAHTETRAESFRQTLNDLYGVTREASASCRILRSLDDVYEQARVAANLNNKNGDVVHQRIAAARSMSEGLKEQTQSLLSLQFSVAANQLENLMRLLTVFSTLFTPLGLLVSICGLNFLAMETFYGNERALYATAIAGAIVLGLTRYWMRASGVF